MNEYVGSGGRKASLAAIREGHGGQQNRQHSSLRESPFIFTGDTYTFYNLSSVIHT